MRKAVAKIRAKTENRELVADRRAQFVAAAIKLFGERGYHSTTIRDIAERAGVSIGLLYHYFEQKEDLLFMALIEVLESYRRQIPLALEGVKDPLGRFCAAVRAYCRVNDATVDATVLAYRETKSLGRQRRELIKQMERETNELIAACIKDCIVAKVFHPKVDIELFTYQIVMFSHAWALKAWQFRRRMTVNEYVDRGLKLMLYPVVTSAGRRQAVVLWKR
jgi:TetR/AcrR family transcriptional regulator, cholesterol catabolism regulator